MAGQRHLGYFEPGILFIMLGFFHAALLISLAHGTITTTVTARLASQAAQAQQTVSFPSPANPDETLVFECPSKCNGGAACEFNHPADCGKYISCDSRRIPLVISCDEGDHFWLQMRQCAPPSQAKCFISGAAQKVDL